ncbi:LysR family transcriptional regulator [Roseicella aquatilis]|uniref:LysR family transcriptional regulator n=1 Tax=Roseicella aquatilis TaxID=2527868 RepID=A0A4R4D721_9PROT|nr:LysR family transcriptional regulator [Roseicella aquatilis]TCZ54569.1 LysR family transcriptional regulator [Roseicella aquatilis]
MERTRHLEMLVRVVEGGSFVAAAAALGLTPSAVSHGIAQLERHLGARLLNRTTRQLRPTEEGEAAYRYGREMLDRLDEMEASIAMQGRSEHVAGTLRVGMSPALGRNVVGPRLRAFYRRYPDLKVKFLAQYQPREMQMAGMDVLLRVEHPGDTAQYKGLVTHLLGNIRHAAYAAPSYLAEAGTPREPEALREHCCLLYKPPQVHRPADEWVFERDGTRRLVRVPDTMETDDREMLLSMATGGCGIIRIGMINPAVIGSGALVRLLPGWSCPPGPPIYALYRRTPEPLPRIVVFLDFVAKALVEFDPRQEMMIRPPPPSAK